ncbi:uncharacterized protein TrAtP1_010145 [Trichoderma atroviride]|uniref:uncharacterized protein n=1 Tax=Hypocrea atroviridis TaxID=63577 RepID=UPI003328C93F|nr:hypothetical protein TrAtP1_010145 [Trichoderma atroviride]
MKHQRAFDGEAGIGIFLPLHLPKKTLFFWLSSCARCFERFLEDATGLKQRPSKDKVCFSHQKFQLEASYMYDTANHFYMFYTISGIAQRFSR